MFNFTKMKHTKIKHITILMLTVFTLTSCATKKVFNGTSTLDCPNYDASIKKTQEKKRSKWRLVLYKDGTKVGGKSKKGKSKLFKK